MSATIPAPHAERFRSAEASGSGGGRDGQGQGAAAERVADGRARSAMRRWCCRRSAARPTASFISPRSPTAPRIEIDLEAFDRLGREVPVLVDLKPSGEHYMEHFHHAGGVPQTDGAARRSARPRCQDHHRRKPARCRGQRRGRCRARTRSARAPIRSSRKARWRCCTAIWRRAAPSSSIRRRAQDCCSTPAAPWCSNPSRT